MRRKILVLLILVAITLYGCSESNSTYPPPPPYFVGSLAEFETLVSSDSTFAPLLTIGYPSIENKQTPQDFSLTYQADGSVYDFNYWLTGVQYRFYYKTYDKEIDRSGMEVVITCNIAGRSVNLYQGTNCLVGEFYDGKYQIMVTVRGHSNLDEIMFEQFNWVIAEQSVETT